MVWVVATLVIGSVVLGCYGVSSWLALPPPRAELACRTCPRLQRELQAWKLGFTVTTVTLVAALIWALLRSAPR